MVALVVLCILFGLLACFFAAWLWRVKHKKPKPPQKSEELIRLEEKEKSLKDKITGLIRIIEIQEADLSNKKEQLGFLNEQNKKILEENDARSEDLKTKNDELARINEEKEKILSELNSINEAIRDAKTALLSISQEQDSTRKELERLKELQRVAVLANENSSEIELWDLSIDEHEQKLISILKEIKSDYPELRIDISTIEWKRIWLSKLQDLGNREGLNCKGVYRLVLKKDPKVCYVGQAQSIQDRWYQHVKKMIGADNKGSEKLYNYRPEDFYWSVIEKGSGVNLNESEHYWIDFYGCKGVGLNKKA